MNIRTLCLGILQLEDATGYEINKLVADGRFSHFIEASYGSIYPALTKMTAEGLVTFREEMQDGRPARKVYSITEEGRRELFHTLSEPLAQDRFKSEFLFFGLFAEHATPERRRQVVDEQEAYLLRQLESLQQCAQKASQPGSRFALGYGIAANRAKLDFLRANKELLLQRDVEQQNTVEKQMDEAQ